MPTTTGTGSTTSGPSTTKKIDIDVIIDIPIILDEIIKAKDCHGVFEEAQEENRRLYRECYLGGTTLSPGTTIGGTTLSPGTTIPRPTSFTACGRAAQFRLIAAAIAQVACYARVAKEVRE